MPGILDGMRAELRAKVARTSQALAVEWQRELLRTSPIDTGAMRTATRVVANQTGRGAEVVASVDTDYAEFVARGTPPHTILPKRPGGVLVFQIGGRTVFTARVSHPGARPNPWWDDSINALPNLIRRIWG